MSGSGATPGHGTFKQFTEPARQVVVLARDEARVLGHDHVGAEHLLLGLVREDRGLAARVLAALGVTLDQARRHAAELARPRE